MKSEPSAYSIDQLKKDGSTPWEGVRNYQARNLMMNDMKIGDQVLFYHSNADPAGIVGLAKVSSKALPDQTQFNRKSPYFDEKSTRERPRWFGVEIKFERKLKRLVSLAELKLEKDLSGLALLQKGQRLSVQPVSGEHFQHILEMSKR